MFNHFYYLFFFCLKIILRFFMGLKIKKTHFTKTMPKDQFDDLVNKL